MTSIEMAKQIFKAADDKKAKDIKVFDMENISDVTDYYLVCSGGSDVQVKAIADNIEDEMDKQGVFLKSKEGYQEGSWILLDYNYCVVQVFLESEREHYNLEKLWLKAPQVDFLE